MENIINSVKNLFVTYGFRAATVIILTIVAVNFLKRPIVKAAERYAKRTGLDKSVITKYISFLPAAVSLLISLIWELIVCDFRFKAIDYGTLCSSALVYAAVAVATFESVKKQMEAYAAKRQKKEFTDPEPPEAEAKLSEAEAKLSVDEAKQSEASAEEERAWIRRGVL